MKIVKGSTQSTLDKNSKPKESKFVEHNHVHGTYRFGEYGVHLVKNTITADKWKVRSGQNVDSYTLTQPLNTPLGLNKDYFFVPRMAILPNAWDLIYTNPVHGDDIDSSEYGTSVKVEGINKFLSSTASIGNTYNDMDGLNAYIKKIILAEAVFSYGALVQALEGGFAILLEYENHKPYDTIFDEWASNLNNFLSECVILVNDGKNDYAVTEGEADNIYSGKWTFRHFLERLRDGENIKIWGLIYRQSGIIEEPGDDIQGWEEFERVITLNGKWANYTLTTYTEPYDIARLWAYQMSCAEFYTNDKIDYIYNANLYRQFVQDMINNAIDEPQKTYEYNGTDIYIDWLSAYYFNKMIDNWTDDGDPTNYENYWNYFIHMFSYRRSLKYMDYFVGSRTQPLAVGDTTIPVQAGNYVDVVDVSKKIMAQKFYNRVKQIGRKVEDFTKGIFGIEMALDYHQPIYLGHTSDWIGAQETENTGEAQMSEEYPVPVTSRFTNGSSRYEFNYECDRYGIILGILSFDIARSYFRGIVRDYSHVNRFDFFNPYMQYTGDQTLKGTELDARLNTTFGYKNAYAEFKEGQNRAFGGFITALKGWTFLDGVTNNERTNELPRNTHQGPDFIRSRATELDRFYKSLTGWSLSNYFHFIIDNDNDCTAIRPMAINPTILA